MILFTTAHVLHFPIEYHQKIVEDKGVNICVHGTLTVLNKQICAEILQIPRLYLLYNVTR